MVCFVFFPQILSLDTFCQSQASSSLHPPPALVSLSAPQDPHSRSSWELSAPGSSHPPPVHIPPRTLLFPWGDGGSQPRDAARIPAGKSSRRARRRAAWAPAGWLGSRCPLNVYKKYIFILAASSSGCVVSTYPSEEIIKSYHKSH